jgi:hypothetical protein
MQPSTPSVGQTPTEQQSSAQVRVGMSVVDSTGTQAGTVTAIQPAGTDVRPDMPAGIAEHYMAAGYLRINGTGFLSNDTYAALDQITAVTDNDSGVVELGIHCDDLDRANG